MNKKKGQVRRAEIGPNPFNAELNISFAFPVEGDVVVEIYDIRGFKVRTLCREGLQKGEHVISWNGRDDVGRELPSGAYIVSVEILNVREIHKVVMVK